MKKKTNPENKKTPMGTAPAVAPESVLRAARGEFAKQILFGPITRRTMIQLRDSWGMTATQFAYAMGSSLRMSRRRGSGTETDAIVPDPSLAILARYYLLIPDAVFNLSSLPHQVDFAALYDRLAEGAKDFSYRRFGVYLGRNSSFGARAQRSGVRSGTTIARLLQLISLDLASSGPGTVIERLEWAARQEAHYRGIDDLTSAHRSRWSGESSAKDVADRALRRRPPKSLRAVLAGYPREDGGLDIVNIQMPRYWTAPKMGMVGYYGVTADRALAAQAQRTSPMLIPLHGEYVLPKRKSRYLSFLKMEDYPGWPVIDLRMMTVPLAEAFFALLGLKMSPGSTNLRFGIQDKEVEKILRFDHLEQKMPEIEKALGQIDCIVFPPFSDGNVRSVMVWVRRLERLTHITSPQANATQIASVQHVLKAHRRAKR